MCKRMKHKIQLSEPNKWADIHKRPRVCVCLVCHVNRDSEGNESDG